MKQQYRPRLLATAGSLAEAAAVMDAGADEISIGEARYGLRVPGPMELGELLETIQEARRRGVAPIVSVNAVVSNEMLDDLDVFLASLERAGAEAIVFGDPAVLLAAKTSAPGLKLHWSAEMTTTNFAGANYWGSKGASRVLLARELNLEQVLAFKQNTSLDVQVQVHGMTNIYHSKRHLVTSYRNHVMEKALAGGQAEDADLSGLIMVEHERPDEKYPVYEDASGTHVMSSDDICMLENLQELLDGGIDVLKVEGFMKSTAYQTTAVRCYRKAIDAYLRDPAGYEFEESWLDPIRELQDPERELSFGFFYKEQVY